MAAAEGKATLADSTAALAQYRAAGIAVLLVDLRGLGETADPAAFNDPKYYNREYRVAQLALHLGRPLLSQRVTDVQILLDWLTTQPHLAAAPVRALATGVAGPVALHAALLYPRITEVVLREAPPSYLHILENPTTKETYSWLLPGVLLHYDLPDLRRVLNVR
ncbi:hypothetical protein CDA63_07740 [Hymenobacter amundsenii]|uniref:AB hydrolase-1 domain-containing protein n=1 Tax=Hymenobacter amundsenii TaxID=2006685 RepID=A0A246FLP6_9BACT|nr:hypothetical protein [Hymenobacter amundsenii]OWP63675.1 hypothetical protein CDA63_07740 [Hymenobacter amundsenii]